MNELRRHAQQNSLEGITKNDRLLYAAACRHFDSWPQALCAAGLENPKKPWIKSAVLAAIRKRQQLGQPLHEVWKTDYRLYHAGQRLFGGWRKALRAAGIPASIRQTWTRERVVAALELLRHTRTVGEKTPTPNFYEAAVRYFGSWSAALASVGLKHTPRQVWSKERVLSETRAWYRQTGGDRDQLPIPLLGAMRRYWGGLTKTLEAAGLESYGVRKWSKSSIILEIQNRHVAGQPIQRPCDVEHSLASAARYHFGNWQKALNASGFVSDAVDSLSTGGAKTSIGPAWEQESCHVA